MPTRTTRRSSPFVPVLAALEEEVHTPVRPAVPGGDVLQAPRAAQAFPQAVQQLVRTLQACRRLTAGRRIQQSSARCALPASPSPPKVGSAQSAHVRSGGAGASVDLPAGCAGRRSEATSWPRAPNPCRRATRRLPRTRGPPRDLRGPADHRPGYRGGPGRGAAVQTAAQAILGRKADVATLARTALASPTVRAPWDDRAGGKPTSPPPSAGRTLEAYIDLVYRTDQGLVVVEYKTAGADVDLDRRMGHYRRRSSSERRILEQTPLPRRRDSHAYAASSSSVTSAATSTSSG